MKKEIVVVVVNALIWGLVIVACAVALRGSGAFKEIQLILGGGGSSLIVDRFCWNNETHSECLNSW